MSMSLLTNITKFCASRSKTLLKRRKIAIKKRPISNKKLKQQAKYMNYAKQYRALQLRKELDKRSYQNRHVDQLMEQIFYPDIAYSNQQALDISLKIKKENFSLLDIQNADYDNHELNRNEQIQQIEGINQQIREHVLAEDILNFYAEYVQNFGVQRFHNQNYVILFEQLSQYFANRYKIKRKIGKDWHFRMNKMKSKNINFKVKSCPYNFYDQQDIYRVDNWNQLISNFATRIVQTDHKDDFIELVNTAISIYKMLSTIPSQIYDVVTLKMLQILSNQKLSLQQKNTLLLLISFHDNKKYPDYKAIDDASQAIQIEQSLKNFCQKLCNQVISDKNCTFIHLQNVIKCFRIKFAHFGSSQSQISKDIVINSLSQINIDKVIDYLQIYLKGTTDDDSTIIDLLKYDVYRKLPTIKSLNSLLKCMSLIRNGQFIKNEEIKAMSLNFKHNAMDLFIKLAETLTNKYCGSGKLNASKTRYIIWLYYINNLKDKNLLQMIANQLVRHKNIITLDKLTQSVFMLNLLEYRSPILNEVLYNQFLNRYQQTKLRCRKQKKLLLTDQNDSKISKIEKTQEQITHEERILEESLIMSIWMSINTSKQANQEQLNKAVMKIKIDNLLKLYPRKILSTHTLIGQLCQNIYEMVKKFKVFWPIIHKTPNAFTVYQFRTQQQHKDRYLKYYNIQLDPIDNAMVLEAQQSQKFILNYNYIEKLFLPQRWSKVQTYNKFHYIQWIISSKSSLQKSRNNYFDSSKQISIRLENLRRQASLFYQKNVSMNIQKQQQNQNSKSQDFQYYKID